MRDSTATEKSQLDQLDQLDPDSPPSAPQWWRDGGGAEKTRQSFSWSPLERGCRARDKPAACLRGAGGGKRGWRLGAADGCETPTRKSIGPRAARRAALASRVGGLRAPPCLGSASVSLLPPPLPACQPCRRALLLTSGHRQSIGRRPRSPVGSTLLASLHCRLISNY